MAQLKFTLLQLNIAWQNKKANYITIENYIKNLSEPTQVVVLPEMFTTGFTMEAQQFAETMDGETVQWMQAMANKYKIILTGSIIINDTGAYYNRLIWMQPNGTYYFYNKRHCFGLAGEQEHYSPGTEKVIVQANGVKVCLQVCYDLRFPVWARQEKGNEYDVLLYVANWPEVRNYAWQQLLISRAIENQSIVIGVNRFGVDGNEHNYCGNSLVISPMGDILQQLNGNNEIASYTINTIDIGQLRQKLPFLKDGDDFKLLV